MAVRLSLDGRPVQGLTDRELMLLQQQDVEQEAQTLADIQRFQAQGLCWASFACAFYDALMTDDSPAPGPPADAGHWGPRFTRAEVMELLGKALMSR